MPRRKHDTTDPRIRAMNRLEAWNLADNDLGRIVIRSHGLGAFPVLVDFVRWGLGSGHLADTPANSAPPASAEQASAWLRAAIGTDPELSQLVYTAAGTSWKPVTWFAAWALSRGLLRTPQRPRPRPVAATPLLLAEGR